MIETAAAIALSHVLAPHVAAGVHAVAPHVAAGAHLVAPHVAAGAHAVSEAAMPYVHTAVGALAPHAQVAVTHALSHATVAKGLAAASKAGVTLPHFLSAHQTVIAAGAGATGAVAGAGAAAVIGVPAGITGGHAAAAASATAHHTSWVEEVARRTAKRAGSQVAKRFYGSTLEELKSGEVRKKVLEKIKTDGLGATAASMLRKMEADGLTR
jgi:hypothetical protein